LEDRISYIKIKSSICWLTIYKFNSSLGYQKLVKFKIIKNIYDKYVNKYLSNLETLPINYYTDTTFVCNKLGEESVGYNKQRFLLLQMNSMFQYQIIYFQVHHTIQQF
jgi:hypothetical protein